MCSAVSPPLALRALDRRRLTRLPASRGTSSSARVQRRRCARRRRQRAERCVGRQAHSLGALGERLATLRSLYAVSAEGRAVTVACAPAPPAATATAKSCSPAHRARAATRSRRRSSRCASRPSTTPTGARARRASSLLAPGTRCPRRLGGEAVCGMSVALAGGDAWRRLLPLVARRRAGARAATRCVAARERAPSAAASAPSSATSAACSRTT